MTNRVCFVLLGILAIQPQKAAAFQIDDGNYLHYVPLEYPRLSRQTNASARFQLFGDRAEPSYRDVSPVDGIDDDRGTILHQVARRFAPFMVQNTFSIPMDHKKLMARHPTFNLYIDT